MADKVADRREQTENMVAGCIAVASLIFADVTAVHTLFGVLLLVYWSQNFRRPSSIRDRLIVSMAMSLAFLVFISYPLNLILNSWGQARSWDIVLLILGIVAAMSFFAVKSKLELRIAEGEA